MTTVFGLSDLHVASPANRQTIENIHPRPHSWLILAGDLGETEAHLRWVLKTLSPKFAQLVWVPGNHELWSSEQPLLHGEAKYMRLVEVCRSFGTLTPEDPWEVLPGSDPPLTIVPLFLLYDYSFAPKGFTPEQAIAWAAEDGLVCSDERRLRPDPFASRQDWCAHRVEAAAARLKTLSPSTRTMLINHWPLRADLCRLFRIPRFTPWCGTTRTEDWHVRFQADVVVYGHLHMRATDWRDGVRFEEISLGYPRHWNAERGADGTMRQIWPPLQPAPSGGTGGPIWYR